MNTTADALSRPGNEDLDWSLSSDVLAAIYRSFPALQMELFASRLKSKFPIYVPRMPGPHAFAVDAFSFKWQQDTYYEFPPFSTIERVLQKVERNDPELLELVATLWPAQTWWPILVQLIAPPCLLLPDPRKILSMSHQPKKTHLLRKMGLAHFRISGQRLKVKAIQKTIKLSSLTLGDHHENSTEHILNNGLIFCDGKTDPVTPNMETMLQFPTKLYRKGLTYSAIGIAPSATNSLLKTVCYVNVNNNSLVTSTRFMKGVLK